MSRFFLSGWLWTCVALLCLVAGVVVPTVYWDWLRQGSPDPVSNGEAVRTVALVVGGGLAFVFALWRALVAQRQAEIAGRTLLDECYERGITALGSENLAVRLGGIYALQKLAQEHPSLYHIQVMKSFCAFVRHPIQDGSSLVTEYAHLEPIRRLREDIQAIVTIIGNRSDECVRIEQREAYVLDLSRAFLQYLWLERGNLASAKLGRADLTNAYLFGTDLSNCELDYAQVSGATLAFGDLSGARLDYSNLSSAQLAQANLSDAGLVQVNLAGAGMNSVNLSGARLLGTDLTAADLSLSGQGPVTGLTQFQLDCARAEKNNPPRLERVRDANTGDLLVWNDRPAGGNAN